MPVSRMLPTLEERHAARVRSRPVSPASAHPRRVPDERRPWAMRHPRATLAIFLALVGFAGWLPPNDAHGATPTRCGVAEDAPGWSWSECGNGARGVILKGAPRHCSGRSYAPGCTTVVDAARYCRLRLRNRIDLKRTPHLKGDGYAMRYGCLGRA